MNLFRLLKELFSPKLKCIRVGHRRVERECIIRERSSGFRTVVADYSCNILQCDRCMEYEGKPYNKEYIEGYSSCSMPAEMWNELDTKGYIKLIEKT